MAISYLKWKTTSKIMPTVLTKGALAWPEWKIASLSKSMSTVKLKPAVKGLA